MYNFHFTLKDTNGQIIEQDRQLWYFEDFLADILDQNYGTPFAWEIVSVERKDLRNGETVKIDTKDGLIKLFEDVKDELEFRKHELDETISDIEVALNDLGKK
jgi:hypothetical protein